MYACYRRRRTTTREIGKAGLGRGEASALGIVDASNTASFIRVKPSLATVALVGRNVYSSSGSVADKTSRNDELKHHRAI
jgi:hypothetical protein